MQAYGRDLAEAQEWCRKYQVSRNVKDLTQAWDLYYHVFRRITKQLPQVSLPTKFFICTMLLETVVVVVAVAAGVAVVAVMLWFLPTMH